MAADSDVLLRDTQPGGHQMSVELAHFGKHPAWEDHMEHLGAETESILVAKRLLYVEGIGEMLNRGRWQALEGEEKLMGFDHRLLWTRGSAALVGMIRESVDGRGRDLYPLVGLAHLRGCPLHMDYGPWFLEMEESMSRLLGVESREMARRLMEGWGGRMQERGYASLDLGEGKRRAFLQMEGMGPEREGFYRLVHVALAAVEYGGDPHLRMRVPLGPEGEGEGYGLWLSFLRLLFGSEVLLLVMRQRSQGFLDVVVGQPQAEDFFCLRAGPGALAMTPEAPYAISAETRAAADALLERFLGGEVPVEATGSRLGRLLQRWRLRG